MPLATTAALGQTTLHGVDQEFERRLDALHELIYTRGGVRPVNTAIDEVSKILFLVWMVERTPDLALPSGISLAEALSPQRIESDSGARGLKEAFSVCVAEPLAAGRKPDGTAQPIWPLDEPFRVDRSDVIAEAVRILGDALRDGRDYDLLGTAFDVFLRGRYDHGGGLGTHLTPHTVVAMLTGICLANLDLLDVPAAGPVAGDPCCGTGRFLVGLIDELRRELDRQDPENPEVARRRGRLDRLISRGLVGADQSPSSVAKAQLNLLLFGAEHPHVFTVEDSITDPALGKLAGKLRLILTNPPFGDGKYDSPIGIARTAKRLPGLAGRKRIDPALAFLVRCLDLLDDGGRLGIVLPDGLIDGAALRSALLHEGDTRLEDVSVEANVALPTATFALAGTVARTSTLVLRKQRAQRSSMFLARADHVGYVRQSGRRAPDPAGDDLPDIRAAYEEWVALNGSGDPETGVRLLTERPASAVAEFAGLGTLDPSRVDPKAIVARTSLAAEAHASLGELLLPCKRTSTPTRDDLPFVSVLHVDGLGSVRWHESEKYRPTTPGRLAKSGEIIVSMLNPGKFRATVIPDAYPEVLVSSEFAVFEPIGDPWQTLALLYDPLVAAQLAPLGRGTSSSRRRLSLADLLSVLAPALSSRELARRGRQLSEATEKIREGYLMAAQAHRR